MSFNMRYLVRIAFIVLLQQMIHAKYMMEFMYFGNCKASSNTLPYHLENSTYGMISSDQSEFNTTLVVEQDFDLMSAKCKMYECRTMNEAECELIGTIAERDHCTRLQEKGQFYSMFGDLARPPIKCPFKKGTHQVLNARVSMETLSKLPILENVVYRLDMIYEHHGKLVGCWKAKVMKHRLRKRKN